MAARIRRDRRAGQSDRGDPPDPGERVQEQQPWLAVRDFLLQDIIVAEIAVDDIRFDAVIGAVLKDHVLVGSLKEIVFSSSASSASGESSA